MWELYIQIFANILGKNRTYFNSPDPDDFKNLLFMLECVAVSVWWGLSQHMVPQATRTGTSGGSAFPPKSWVPLLTMAAADKARSYYDHHHHRQGRNQKRGLRGHPEFCPPEKLLHRYIAIATSLHCYIATSLHC